MQPITAYQTKDGRIFSTAEEAGKAYKKASILLVGEFSPYHEDEDAN